ncbi:MAG: aquaporin family protein [Sphingomonadales bacterium]|nr:aquaporin family protein [Sphingomonadales bacterium]
MNSFSLARRLAAEAVGSAFLLAVVVGSNLMGERLTGGDPAMTLLAASLATGAVLFVIISMFGGISGAHFNPAVTLGFLIRRQIPAGDAGLYVVAQIAGALVGVVVAHLMFELPPLVSADVARPGANQWLGEFIATFGLVAAIFLCMRFRPEMVGATVGLFIGAGYWFTISTSFANPAVTLARMVSAGPAGIDASFVPGFIAAQLAGAAAAALFCAWIVRDDPAQT